MGLGLLYTSCWPSCTRILYSTTNCLCSPNDKDPAFEGNNGNSAVVDVRCSKGFALTGFCDTQINMLYSGGFRGFSRFLGGASRGRAGAWCGLTAGEHARSFWLIRASRPIHLSCPRTTVCADVMLVGSRSRVVIPAPAWSKQIKDRLSGVAPYRYPPATSS